jgi:hypothetical protein
MVGRFDQTELLLHHIVAFSKAWTLAPKKREHRRQSGMPNDAGGAAAAVAN